MDLSACYFAINWMFLFNVRERCRDSRAPNLLVYYKLTTHNTTDSITAKVIGAQADSLTLLQRVHWNTAGYKQASERLREFIAFGGGTQHTNKKKKQSVFEHFDYHYYKDKFYDVKE